MSRKDARHAKNTKWKDKKPLFLACSFACFAPLRDDLFFPRSHGKPGMRQIYQHPSLCFIVIEKCSRHWTRCDSDAGLLRRTSRCYLLPASAGAAKAGFTVSLISRLSFANHWV